MDQFYIEPDYYLEGYFVYTADAMAGVNSNSTLDCVVGKIVETAADLVAEFTQTATISHIEGADMFAFSEAQIAVTVDRIRDNNVAVSAVFDTAIDYIRIVQSNSDVFAEFIQAVTPERSRDVDLQTLAAFSFEINVERLANYSADFVTETSISVSLDRFRDNNSALESAFELLTEGGVIKPGIVNLSSDAALTAIISHIQGADIVAENFASLDIVADLFKAFDANLTSNFTVAADYTVIKEDVVVVIETFFNLNASVGIVKQFNSNNSSNVILTAEPEVTKNFAVDLQSQTAISVQAQANKVVESQLTSEVELDIFASVLLDSGVLEFASIASKLTVGRLVNLDMKVYVIPAETRIHRIDTETRLHRIGAETRIFAIRSTK